MMDVGIGELRAGVGDCDVVMDPPHAASMNVLSTVLMTHARQRMGPS